MEFYRILASHYDKIFPFNQTKKDFVNKFLPDQKATVLDIGCATGSLLAHISESRNFNDNLYGIDLDQNLLKIARNKIINQTNLLNMNMLDISQHFADGYFDLIFCLGNTLVHLPDENHISSFLAQSHKLLKQSAKLIIQIINYEKFITLDTITDLPSIKTKHLSFKREYSFSNNKKNIIFTGILTDRNNKTSEAATVLYPISKTELEKLLIAAGFKTINFYGDFKFSNLTPDNTPLIAVCEK
jgi:2-polyprenyl-3-methyl-5-hydroxy-6-metoxy-1,4-benzoquinol methylase